MTMAVKGGETSASSFIIDNTFKLDDIRHEGFEQVRVIRQLPQLFEIDQGQCRTRVIPLIEAALEKDKNYELHSVAASTYLELITSKSIDQRDLYEVFLPSILGYLDSWDPEIRDTWLNVLLDIINILPEDEIDKLCYLALDKCHVNEDYRRCAAVRILGRICATGTNLALGNIANSKIWPVLQSLSQDVESSVRAAVCQQLHFVAPVLNLAVLKRSLIPCVIELARDEDKIVKAEALEACIKLAEIVPVGVLKTSLLPLILSVARGVKNFKIIRGISVRLAVNIAPLWTTLRARGVLEPETRNEIIKIFHKLAVDAKNCKDVLSEGYCLEIRRVCAESLPVLFETSQPGVGKIFGDFVADPSPEVRKAAAVSLTKCANHSALVKPLHDLLMDADESVLSVVISNLSSTVNQLCTHKVFGSLFGVNRQCLAEAILGCGQFVNNSRNWRLTEQYYLQIPCVVGFLTSNYIFEHFYPRVTRRILTARALPVRHASCRALLMFLRFNLTAAQRQKMRDWLRIELLLAHSCYHRLLFIGVCETAMEIFSKNYIITHFFQHVLTLQDDPVVNVRLALAAQLPKLLTIAKGNDSNCDIIRKARTAMLAKETDRDVIMALNAPQVVSEVINADDDRRRREEEAKLSNKHGLTIASEQQTPISKPSIRSQYSVKKPFCAAVKKTQNSDRTNSTNHGCTCARSGLAMEMSWLNLEMELHRELRTFRVYRGGHKRATLFTCSFDQDFYRDAGVLPEQLNPPKAVTQPQQPTMLAQSGRSKSFVMPTSSGKLTRIPVSHRHSMDVNQWAARDVLPSASRLPVRHIPKLRVFEKKPAGFSCNNGRIEFAKCQFCRFCTRTARVKENIPSWYLSS